jgi:hypothetical protein
VQFVRQVDDLAGARDGLGDGTVGEPGKPLGRHGVGLLPFVQAVGQRSRARRERGGEPAVCVGEQVLRCRVDRHAEALPCVLPERDVDTGELASGRAHGGELRSQERAAVAVDRDVPL